MSVLAARERPTTDHIRVIAGDPFRAIEHGHLFMVECPKEVEAEQNFEVTLSTDLREGNKWMWVERFVEYKTVVDTLVDLPLEGTIDVGCEDRHFEYSNLSFDAEATGHVWLLEFYLYQRPMSPQGVPLRGCVQIGQVSQRIKVKAPHRRRR